MSDITFTYSDAGDEKSSVTVPISPIDGTIFTHADAITARGAMQTALGGIVRGRLRNTILTDARTKVSNLPGAASDEAQREEKLLVLYQDDTTLKLYRMELPCANIAALTRIAETDDIELLDSGNMAAFVTAFNANVVSEAGNACSVVRAILVGRNL